MPDSVVEEWISVERLEQKKNHRQAATGRRLDICRKGPTVIIEKKEVTPMRALKGEPQTQRDRGTDLNNVVRQDLSCPGFHGQLIRRLQRTVLHGRLIIQRLMKSFTIVKQFDVLKDFASCFIPRLKVAVVNEFIL